MIWRELGGRFRNILLADHSQIGPAKKIARSGVVLPTFLRFEFCFCDSFSAKRGFCATRDLVRDFLQKISKWKIGEENVKTKLSCQISLELVVLFGLPAPGNFVSPFRQIVPEV